MKTQVLQTVLDNFVTSAKEYNKKVKEMEEAYNQMVKAKEAVDELFR